MDSLTQATLGAAIGHAMLGEKIGGKAAIIGAVVATIPDLDVLLTPFFNEVQKISLHRGYSHSIILSFLGAFFIAYILSKIKWTSQFSFWKLTLFVWLALFTHIMLDAFTTFGTQLFLPFSDYRVSFDSITIVDPFYTLPLLIGLLVSIFLQRKKGKYSKANSIGIIISSSYLLFTLVTKQYISETVETALAHQNIQYNSLKTIPVGVGSTNWYGVAKSQDSLFIGRYSALKNNHIDFHSFPINDQLLDQVDQQLAYNLKWFSQDYYTVAQDKGKIRLYNLQCDMQGVRTFGDYKAPTAFYFEITPSVDSTYDLTTGMHPKNN